MCPPKRSRAQLILFLTMLVCVTPAGAQPLDMRVRVTWGGGTSRLWHGSVRVPEGQVRWRQCLGIEADAPTSIETNNGVGFRQPCPTRFDGMDLQISAASDQKIVIEMATDEPNDAARPPFQIPVSDLILNQDPTLKFPLDDRGNWLFIRRAPGDELRVEFDRDSLVFAPGERFSFLVKPHLLDAGKNVSLRCAISLRPSAEDRELWRTQLDVRARADGGVDPVGPVDITLPAEEGVYDVVVSLAQRRFPEALMRSKPLVERKVQLIVVGPNLVAPVVSEWHEVDAIDLTNREGWERWVRLPQLNKLSGTEQSPFGSGELRTQERLGRKLAEIAGDQWYAAPVPISRIGQPHLLEVEYPNDVPQTLGISLLQPNAAGDVMPLGVDSGIDVDAFPKPAAAKIERHRLVFWPRTKTPWLLLTNRRRDTPAVFGRIRVLSGPASLPPAAVAAAPSDGRLLAAYCDRPLFPDNFSAPETLDEHSQHSLDDWKTFYFGGSRLVEYLQYAGQNAAVISVVRDGSAIYPSQLMSLTPKYDTGTFFTAGQDPLPKDVLEMLFRLFDRAGLQLIPAIYFGAPLAELEELLRRGEPDAAGIELVGVAGDGNSLTQGRFLARRGLAPYYNPLDDRVQAAMQRVVHELAVRYGHHSSFTGVCLQVGADTFLQLPDESWPCDDRTVGRFVSATRVAVPGEGASRFTSRSQFFRGAGRDRWLQWRAASMAEFHRATQQQLERVKSGTKLYLAVADLLASTTVQQTMRPKLLARWDVSQVLLRHGIDVSQYQDSGNVVLLRPQRWAPLTSLASQAVNIELSHSPNVDAVFRNQKLSGALNLQEPLVLRLADFDQRSPFGPENTYTWLAAHIPPSGPRSRARLIHSLAALDAQFVADGGWVLPLGQEDEMRGIVEVFRQLPAERFQTWAPLAPSALGADVVIRTLSRATGTYIYVVNDSPWQTVVQVELGAPASCTVQSLSSRTLPQLTVAEGTGTRPVFWTLELEPYDLVGARLSAPNVSVKDWRVSYRRKVEAELNDLVVEILSRVDRLQRPEPVSVLANPDFEAPAQGADIPGWFYSQKPGVVVRTDNVRPKRGNQSLYMRADNAVAWIRSQPFAPPRTGRIHILAWIRTRDPQKQPPLRMAVDGLLNGEPYYRCAPLGLGQETEKIPDNWDTRPFLFSVDDLPTSGMTEVLVGFDLMGPGEVWIDDVQVFDLYFQPNEQDVLSKNVGLAGFHLANGRISECARYLDSYWPRFVLEFVPPPARVATRPESARGPIPAQPDEKKEDGKSRSWNRFMPRLPWQSPLRGRN